MKKVDYKIFENLIEVAKENQLEDAFQAIENALYAEADIIEDDSTLYEEETILNVDPSVLNNIEPSSNDDSTETQTSDDQTERSDYVTEKSMDKVEPLGFLDDMGPLNSTTLIYLSEDTNELSSENQNLMMASIQINEETPEVLSIEKIITSLPEESFKAPVEQNIEEPTVETYKIILSNKTDNSQYINNEDAFTIESEKLKGKDSIDGSELNIESVKNSAEFFYKVSNSGNIRAELKSDWNSVKNIEIETNYGSKIVAKNFVHTNINVDSDDSANISVIAAKRGEISTGSGDDKIFISAETNGSGWSNTFHIDTNEGHDRIILRGDKGHTIFDINAGDGNDLIRMKGHYNHSSTDLAAGDDRFIGGKSADIIDGGSGDDKLYGKNGDDVLIGGQGSDLLVGGKGSDTFLWTHSDVNNGALDHVKDFQAKQGDVLDIANVLDFGDDHDDVISDFVRFADASRKKDATLEIRESGEGDWQAVATIVNGAKLDSVEEMVDNGSLII